MGSRKEYWCDLCDEKYDWHTGEGKLIGLRFTNNRDFKLESHRSTDGKHLCMRCISQIWNQAPTVMAGA